MRALIFTTGTRDTEKLIRSWTCLGHETKVERYDVTGFDIVGVAEREHADVGIYIGAVPGCHDSWVPSTDLLVRVNRAIPMIHICSDSADDPWWPLLEDYHKAKAFRLQVGIDGCWDSPMSRIGRVELTPVDPENFPEPEFWDDRPYVLGFAGGGGFRTDFLKELQRSLGGSFVWPEGEMRYPHMCAFYTLCRGIVNDDRTGSAKRHHVKGRFVEAAMAGAVVVEPAGSPVQHWFRPGVDYLIWRDLEDIAIHATKSLFTDDARDMAVRLRNAVVDRWAPKPFWTRTLNAAGITL